MDTAVVTVMYVHDTGGPTILWEDALSARAYPAPDVRRQSGSNARKGHSLDADNDDGVKPTLWVELDTINTRG
jgi:hypothetical protein